MVSVCCFVYNHEKYLRQCLDGFLMQKTNFKFEVLIHDDASTDSSTDIIKEYEKKYPDVIKPIYQKENQYSQGIKIAWKYQYPRAKGKYIALCEGDDFWIDSLKLQQQFDSLEKNKSCVFCAHRVQSVTESGELLNNFHPDEKIKTQCINGDTVVKTLLSEKPYIFQTSSYFFRTSCISEHFNNIPEFIKLSSVGDAPLMMLLATKGDFYYIDYIMSCYRKFSINSWSSQFANNNNIKIRVISNAILSFQSFDSFTENKYSCEVNNKCLREEFKLLRVKREYKKLLEQRFKILRKEESIKERVYIQVFGHFPKLEHLYQKIRGRK